MIGDRSNLDAVVATERRGGGQALSDGSPSGSGGTITSLVASGGIEITSSGTGGSVKTLSVGWLDTDQSHRLRLASGENLSADRTLTVILSNAARQITIAGTSAINQDVQTTGTPQFARLGLGAAAHATAAFYASITANDASILEMISNTATQSANQILRRARVGPADASANDRIGQIIFRAYNSAASQDGYGNAAFLRAEVDSVFSTNANGVNGRLLFLLCESAAQVERVRVTNLAVTLTQTGQTTSALVTANSSGLILTGVGGGAAGAGGALVFGSGAGQWGAFKGLLVNGGSNTTGDIAVSLRRATTDGALTEVARWTVAGNYLVGGTSETGLTGAGGVRIFSTTEATTSAGAAIVDGGVLAKKAIFTTSTTDSSSGTTGSIVTSGGVGIAKKVYQADTTEATATTGAIVTAGGISAAKKIFGGSFGVGANQVVGARVTGWGAPTGTATRTAFATHATQTISSPPTQTEVQNIDNSLVLVATRLKALIDDLTTHGLIGA